MIFNVSQLEPPSPPPGRRPDLGFIQPRQKGRAARPSRAWRGSGGVKRAGMTGHGPSGGHGGQHRVMRNGEPGVTESVRGCLGCDQRRLWRDHRRAWGAAAL